MGQINDFCQFLSAFDETKRNEVFGATSPIQKHGGIDGDWFNEEYDSLISQLIANMSTALASQLNQDYRNAICAAPYQFGLLKQSLWQFLHRLYRGDQLQDGLNFRGFYFTHSGTNQAQHDVLANVVNQSTHSERHWYWWIHATTCESECRGYCGGAFGIVGKTTHCSGAGQHWNRAARPYRSHSKLLSQSGRGAVSEPPLLRIKTQWIKGY